MESWGYTDDLAKAKPIVMPPMGVIFGYADLQFFSLPPQQVLLFYHFYHKSQLTHIYLMIKSD